MSPSAEKDALPCPGCFGTCRWDNSLRVWACDDCGDVWDAEDGPRFARIIPPGSTEDTP